MEGSTDTARRSQQAVLTPGHAPSCRLFIPDNHTLSTPGTKPSSYLLTHPVHTWYHQGACSAAFPAPELAM